MKRLLSLILVAATCALAQNSPQRNSYGPASQGATFAIPNVAGSQAVSFEYLFSATPAAVSITIQGCMRGNSSQPGNVGTCDAATDTYTGTTNSIRSPSFTKVYDTFLITVGTLTGATVTINTTVVVSKSGTSSGSSGSGTVSPNNGSAGAIANYAAAGGSTTVGPDATLLDNGTRLVYSGTTGLQLPAGACPNPGLSLGGSVDGFYQFGTHQIGACSNGFVAWNFNGSDGFDLNPGTTINFAGGTALNGNGTTLRQLNNSAAGSGTLQVGGGTNFAESGLLRWNTCKVTADITLPVNTATTVCSWPLPGVAASWAWQCQIPWVISAGTGTNTLAIIANPSQTPTGTTNGSAEIKTTNTNTATEATTAISVSGATTLLTSGTITPNAAVFMSSTSGTLLASATAGTFAIQMTAAGTTATAAAKAGATCVLY